MSRFIVLVVLLVVSEGSKMTNRFGTWPGGFYKYQMANTDGTNVFIKNNGATFQSIDSNGNVQKSTINLGNSNSARIRMFNNEGNNLVFDLSSNPYYDDYYDDQDPIHHHAKLMNRFINEMSNVYNHNSNDEFGNVEQYIFIHYYAGKVVSPYLINYRQNDLTECPPVEYCLNGTRPLCIDSVTYCIAPMRKTIPCLKVFNNGKLPCLTTTVPIQNDTEEEIVLPCLTTLAEIGTKKKYCATIIVVNTHLKETMSKVQRTVKDSMARAQVAIQQGLKAGQEGLMRGMNTMREAFAKIRKYPIDIEK